jgi:hypothetical protein
VHRLPAILAGRLLGWQATRREKPHTKLTITESHKFQPEAGMNCQMAALLR